MNKKKLILAGIAAAAVIVIIVAAVSSGKKSKGSEETASDQDTVAVTVGDGVTGSDSSVNSSSAAASSSSSSDSGSKKDSKSKSGSGSDSDDGSSDFDAEEYLKQLNLGGGTSSGGSASAGTGESGSKTIALPYSIPGTDLVLDNMDSYSGMFVEDGSDDDVENVAALVVRNNGSSYIQYGAVTVQQGDTVLEFDFSTLGPGEKAAVMEKNKAGYSDAALTSADATVAVCDKFDMSSDKIKVEENEDGALEVTNISGEDIVCARIFYKFYMSDEDAYVGGITYTAKVTDLAAGASVEVTPSHYISGSSKVVMIRTYDTAED